MRKFSLGVIIVFSTLIAFGQKETKPTSSFVITGEIKSGVTITTEDLKKWTAHSIGDVTITNHLGEKKSEAKGLKGVLLRDVLSSVEFKSETPKGLSQYYFVCKANDGYTVVYSWNELFNTAVGDAAYIVTEKEGKPASAMEEAVLMISPKDFKTGRRHVKALASIDVRHAE